MNFEFVMVAWQFWIAVILRIPKRAIEEDLGSGLAISHSKLMNLNCNIARPDPN